MVKEIPKKSSKGLEYISFVIYAPLVFFPNIPALLLNSPNLSSFCMDCWDDLLEITFNCFSQKCLLLEDKTEKQKRVFSIVP